MHIVGSQQQFTSKNLKICVYTLGKPTVLWLVVLTMCIIMERGGRERERGRKGGREIEKDGDREGGRQGGREVGREGGKEIERERYIDGKREIPEVYSSFSSVLE